MADLQCKKNKNFLYAYRILEMYLQVYFWRVDGPFILQVFI